MGKLENILKEYKNLNLFLEKFDWEVINNYQIIILIITVIGKHLREII